MESSSVVPSAEKMDRKRFTYFSKEVRVRKRSKYSLTDILKPYISEEEKRKRHENSFNHSKIERLKGTIDKFFNKATHSPRPLMY